MNIEPDEKELNALRSKFEHLFGKRSKVRAWYDFFQNHSSALSSSCELVVIEKSVKFSSSPRPDIVLYPMHGEQNSRFGLLELNWRRVDKESELGRRTGLVKLGVAANADSAFEECRERIAAGDVTVRHAERNVACLGNEANILLVMGLDAESYELLFEELLKGIETLPTGVQLYSYSDVCALSSRKSTPQIVQVRTITPSANGGSELVADNVAEDIVGRLREKSACG